MENAQIYINKMRNGEIGLGEVPIGLREKIPDFCELGFASPKKSLLSQVPPVRQSVEICAQYIRAGRGHVRDVSDHSIVSKILLRIEEMNDAEESDFE